MVKLRIPSIEKQRGFFLLKKIFIKIFACFEKKRSFKILNFLTFFDVFIFFRFLGILDFFEIFCLYFLKFFFGTF